MEANRALEGAGAGELKRHRRLGGKAVVLRKVGQTPADLEAISGQPILRPGLDDTAKPLTALVVAT